MKPFYCPVVKLTLFIMQHAHAHLMVKKVSLIFVIIWQLSWTLSLNSVILYIFFFFFWKRGGGGVTCIVCLSVFKMEKLLYNSVNGRFERLLLKECHLKRLCLEMFVYMIKNKLVTYLLNFVFSKSWYNIFGKMVKI